MQIKSIPVGELGTNCYFLIDETTNSAAIIDPGAQGEQLVQILRELGVTLHYILLTHGHYDHTTAVPEIHAAFPDAKVYIHKADANGTGNHLFPLAGQIETLSFYDEGDTLPLGDLTIEVLHTPGHSKGSVVLKVNDALFSGDTLFYGSCGRVDLPGGDEMQMQQSLLRLARLEGNYHVLPGHDRITTLDKEREGNPFICFATEQEQGRNRT